MRLTRLATLALLALSVLTGPRAALAEVVALEPGADLAAALAAAEPGTVLELAGGDYGALAVKGAGGTAEAPVTLRSADPANPARLSRMDLREVTHLVIEGVVFDYEFAPEDPQNLRPFQVFTTRGLTIRNSVFDGDLAEGGPADESGYPTAFGLAIRASAEITLEGNEIRDFYRGLVVGDVVDITVQRNDLHSLRMDGMNFAQVERALIEENTIRDFKRAVNSGDHADMIQFWTNRTERPSRDIVIRGNILNSGLGRQTQSIFMRNEEVDRGRAGDEMFYRNITIEENVIINAHAHGITVGETEGLTIRQNTLVHNARSAGEDRDRDIWRPRIRIAPDSRAVQVTGNAAHGLPDPEERPGWTFSNNLEIQDLSPNRPNHYDKLFIAALGGDPRDLASFRYLPDSPLARDGIGAARLRPGSPAVADAVRSAPAIHAVADDVEPLRFTFDATLGSQSEGLATAEIRYDWDFGDGVTATGARAEHRFAQPGEYRVLLRLTLADGAVLESTSLVYPRPPELIRYDPEAGEILSFAGREPERLAIGNGDGRILMGGENPVTTVPARMIAPFFGAERFEIALRIRSPGDFRAAGEILRVHPFLIVTATPRGSLAIRFTTETASPLQFTTRSAPLYSGDWVDLTFRYSARDGSFEVLAGGTPIGSGRTNGPTATGRWGLALGNPFATRKTFDGEVGGLSVSVGLQ
jgi:hypothetical protein